MRRRFAVVLLAATAAAAVFVLPAQASSKSTHKILSSGVRAIHRPAAAGPRSTGVNIAWTPAATIPVAVEETGGGAAVGNSFYVIGGFTNFAPVTVVNNNQLYNKATNSWSQKAVIPANGGGWGDAAFCFNKADKTIHVVDGTDGSFIYAAHQVYNTTTDTWTNEAIPNTPADGNYYAQDPGCAFIGGKMYLFGGYGLTDTGPHSTPAVQSLTWVYDPVAGTWSDTGKSMVHPRLWMGYASNTTNAFAAGGTDNVTTFAPMNSSEKFAPATGWTALGNLPAALLAPGMGIVANTHMMVFGGGDATFTTQNKTYHCNPTTCASWTTTAFNLPVAKWFSAFGSGSSLFNAGGDTGSGTPTNDAEHLP
jgi:hypothetical protein